MNIWIKRISLMLAAPALLAAAPAFAQTAEAPATSAAAEEPKAAEPTLADVQGKIEGIEETLGEVKSTSDILHKLKFGGYVQGRFEYHQDSADQGAPVTNQFLLRRGRLKATYAGSMSEYVLEIDASSSAPSLKDGEATFIEPWTGLGLHLTAGQFKLPFGHSVLQSDKDCELPEKPLAIRKMFPGDRDRGARFQGSWDVLRLQAAVINGNGTGDTVSSTNDSSGFKDIVGRLGVDLDWIVAGVSAYSGKGVTGYKAATAATYKVDSTTKAVVLDKAATKLSYLYAAKTRYGIDAELYFDVPVLGGLAIKGEAIIGEEGGLKQMGWYGQAKQGLGDQFAVFARVDAFDPNTDVANDDTMTVGGGVQYLPAGNLKISATYEHLTSRSIKIANADPKDDILTLQVQSMF